MKTVAVIPAYNEQGRIAACVRDAAMFCEAVVVVDDCSRDNCGSEAGKAGAYVLRHVINRGQGAALQTGTDFAVDKLDADIVVHFDADGQMMAEEIPKMIEPIVRGGADIVLGSRFLGSKANIPFTRWVVLKLGLLFTMVISGIRVTDTHNGFRALSRKAATSIRITLDRMAHASEILDLIKTRGLRHVERPVTIRYSEETLAKGQSSLGAFRIVKDIIRGKFFDV
jgi:glycosyltransferase involved in cell wall biosynthesis